MKPFHPLEGRELLPALQCPGFFSILPAFAVDGPQPCAGWWHIWLLFKLLELRIIEHSRLGWLRIARKALRKHGNVTGLGCWGVSSLVNLVSIDLVKRVAFGVMHLAVLGLVLDHGT
jgi:hypothetical protein